MRRLVLPLVLLSAATALGATVLVPADFREVVASSQIIVHGRVVDVRAEWRDNRRRIDTVVTVEPGTYLKGAPLDPGPGSPPDTLTFTVPGGRIGRYKNVMIGAPEFHEGDEAILFLTSQGSGVPHVFGLSQGLYRVRVDPQTGRRIVLPPLIQARGDAAEVVKRGDPARRPMSLDEFAGAVRTAMQPFDKAQGGPFDKARGGPLDKARGGPEGIR
ncbi:MAG: hypothetical protein A3H96_12410 [Acidobacteria bacterium RIFCSPLOWO2_02_FULL_67_36]|nr:MAG: hypothetical protein A3H96_12410 [Acidobacteria bacterium RIFCSPLOWO2_02_FULL_67_36]